MAKDRYHHGNLRVALITAATELIDTGGPEAFSIAAASRVVGVTHAAAYKHFANKQDVLRAVSDVAMTAFGDALQAAYDEHTGPREQYLATARAVVAFACDRPHLYALAFGSTRRDDSVTLADPPPDSVLGRFSAMIASWQAAGWLAEGDPARVAVALWSTAHGLALLVASGRVALSTDEAEALTDTLFIDLQRGFGPR